MTRFRLTAIDADGHPTGHVLVGEAEIAPEVFALERWEPAGEGWLYTLQQLRPGYIEDGQR